ncbi:hypothetical protein GCM10007938_12710 [Vibrio zhanjiangensis]|uniref:DUF3103 domain-containing protein n=1 Tax=Vibrio zhanjiangensis TaxID=1046128 RepID=A0ABQ6EXE0_9VIBR|nr:DUF3103 domain-containing protein [Vibrio zhanjiangensis]GLT17494.1 hypothetical protein GCM10007938_12710 [Vibrio zhanjiangensis]
MRPNLPISLVLATTMVGLPLNAQTVNTTDAQSISDEIAQQKQALALQLSARYFDLEKSIKSQITEKHLATALDSVDTLQPHSAFKQQMQQADYQYRQTKGITQYTDSVMELRIADASMVKNWKEGQSPLFAFEPSGDDSNWQYVEAYDVYGQVHQLDVYQMPDVPVLVVDSNSAKELQAGLKAMQAEMKRLGQDSNLITNGNVDKQVLKAKSSIQRSAQVSDVEPLNTTQLTKIRLNDDEEPWISGKAEVYAIITGVDPSRVEPEIDLVDMPYLDYDGKDYYPRQTMIFWPRYRWGAVDMILMEQDDGTDYKELAKILVKAAEDILKMIPDPEIQGYAIIAQITNRILDVIPDGVLTNDDDYLDSYYTIMQNTPYVERPGAGGNVVATFKPVTISPTE